MKRILFIIYALFTSAFYIVLLLWLASVREFQINYDDADILFKIAFRIASYWILVLLLYRSGLIILKTTVQRLASWRSKREQIEDAEFVLIVETLLLIIATLTSCLVAIFDKWIQSDTIHQKADAALEDLFISFFGIFLSSIVIYSLPVVGELEYAIKHRIEVTFRRGNR